MAKDNKKLANKQYYTVGEAAHILGVTPLTLRNWDKKGKLNARRNPVNNYRMYKASDLELFLRKMDRSSNSGGIMLDIV